MPLSKLLFNSLSEWHPFFISECKKSYFKKLDFFIQNEYLNSTCYPEYQDIFKIFCLLKPNDIKVIILGQDPYSTKNMADGIAFSVKNKKLSKSLSNIIKVIKSNNFECKNILQGDLTYLAKQGVFLINTCLTVREKMPLSHQNQGWEIFIQNIVQKIVLLQNPVCLLIWGKKADNFLKKIKFHDKNYILKTSHPSPLSFYKGFNKSQDFVKCNIFLEEYNINKIDWGAMAAGCSPQEK